MELNKWEMEILNIAKENGQISLNTCAYIYRDPNARREALKRLTSLGYLDANKVPQAFTWTGKEFEKKIKSKKSIFTKEQQEQIKESLESCEGSELENTLRDITKINRRK